MCFIAVSQTSPYQPKVKINKHFVNNHPVYYFCPHIFLLPHGKLQRQDYTFKKRDPAFT